MIIDSHTHIFPEKIAKAALDRLSSVIQLTPATDGTINGLRSSMEKSGIDISVVLPIVTNPHQFDSILRFAVHINENYADCTGPRLLSLAGIHPIAENYKDQLRLIKDEGFAGIKVHPNYQGLHFDDIHYLRLIYAASELGLSVITHAGADPYTPEEFFCTPQMILNVIREVAPPRLIIAHMGSNENYDEAESVLCGQNIYLDTAYSIMHMSEEQLTRMIHKHGADKILFGTDSPWTQPKDCADRLQALTGLSREEKELILHGNAEYLFGIN